MTRKDVVIRLSDAQSPDAERLALVDSGMIDLSAEWAKKASRQQLMAVGFALLCREADRLEEPSKTRIRKNLEVLQCLRAR